MSVAVRVEAGALYPQLRTDSLLVCHSDGLQSCRIKDLTWMAGDWDSERLNAEGLLRCLAAEDLEEGVHRRGLLKRWPEAPCSEHDVPSSESERFIPELFLRGDDEDSFRFLQTFIRRSVSTLLQAGEGDQSVYDGQHEVVKALGELSDLGVIEAIPGLLEKLERKALLSIYAIVSGKTCNVRNRAYLVDKVKEFSDKVLPGQPLTERMQEVVTVLRDPDSYKKMESRRIELAASSPVEAAHSALLLVDQLPLKDMHIMLETLKSSPPRKIGQQKVGGNKGRLITKIRAIADRHLSEIEDGDELPAPLRKSLVVMSLSARHAFGNDGKLMDFLGPIPMEKQSLHRSILSALSSINYVKNENLLILYKDLDPPASVSSKTKSSTIRSRITSLFLDCLLSSEIRRVPGYIRRAAEKLEGMMRQQLDLTTKTKCRIEKNDLRRTTELELEAVARVSSHLQQVMHDLRELSEESLLLKPGSDSRMVTCSRRTRHTASPSENRQLTLRSPEGAFLTETDARASPLRSQDVVARLDYHLDDGTMAAMGKQMQIWSSGHTPDSVNEEGVEKKVELREICPHEALSQAETNWLRDVTRIGDEAAGVGYTLIGCVLEKMSRLTGQRLQAPVKDYLRRGVKRRLDEAGVKLGPKASDRKLCDYIQFGVETEVERDLNEQGQVSFILSLAQNDPRISSRTMDRVKRRLVE